MRILGGKQIHPLKAVEGKCLHDSGLERQERRKVTPINGHFLDLRIVDDAGDFTFLGLHAEGGGRDLNCLSYLPHLERAVHLHRLRRVQVCVCVGTPLEPFLFCRYVVGAGRKVDDDIVARVVRRRRIRLLRILVGYGDPCSGHNRAGGIGNGPADLSQDLRLTKSIVAENQASDCATTEKSFHPLDQH